MNNKIGLSGPRLYLSVNYKKTTKNYKGKQNLKNNKEVSAIPGLPLIQLNM